MSQGFVNSGFNAKCAGDVIQVQRYQTGDYATGSTVIPYDNTIPQNTEGDQYMSVSITPTNVNSTLIIDVVFQGLGYADQMTVALFQDSTANALKAVSGGTDSDNTMHSVVFSHSMTAATTSATTFKVRMGSSLSGTNHFNGYGSGALYGGVSASSITVTEIASGTLVRESGYNINGNAGVAKAWCMFNGNTAGTNAPTVGHNVTSVTKNGTGDYTVNFTTPFSSANYVASGVAQNAANPATGVGNIVAHTPAAGTYRFLVKNSVDTSVDSTITSLVFFGTQ